MDGVELCRNLKRTELTSHIPVVMISSLTHSDSQTRALQGGADRYLARPINPVLLKARVEELLRTHLALPGCQPGGSESQPAATVLAANPADAQFLLRATETVDRHLSDFEFDVDALAKMVAVSRRQLFRKLKAVTGVTPNAFIRTMRLNRAAQLLKDSQMTVTEITYAVGFFDLKHFRALFLEQFGVLPSEYSRELGCGDNTRKGGSAGT
jgi:AraC-like DNA-binding protein